MKDLRKYAAEQSPACIIVVCHDSLLFWSHCGLAWLGLAWGLGGGRERLAPSPPQRLAEAI